MHPPEPPFRRVYFYGILRFALDRDGENGNIRAKLGKRQRRGILHGASESRKLLGDAKQQTNSVELTSEPLLPNLE